MRKGVNPQKRKKKIELEFQHRLIILVFVPEEDDYYKNIVEVFKLCLESAIMTINKKCAITVVNNGSCKIVKEYIDKKFKEGAIDTVIHHKKNIGKIDAIIGAARASREPIITLSDVDILYKWGWQQEVEKVFNAFKDVGSVSPLSVKSTFRYANASTITRIITKKLNFSLEEIPENYNDYNLYLKSLNWSGESKKHSLWPVVMSKKKKAILGSAHQVLTVDRKVLLKNTPVDPSLALIGKNSVFDYCDGPIDYSGGLRLSTYNNFAYHMGNNVEGWMVELQKRNIEKSKVLKKELLELHHNFNPRKNSPLLFKIKKFFFVKIFNMLYFNKINKNL